MHHKTAGRRSGYQGHPSHPASSAASGGMNWCIRTAAATAVALVSLMLRYARGRRREEADWCAIQSMDPLNLGSVDELRVLPLVDARAGPGLLAEPGLSYLLVTDQWTILFDLGLSAGRRSRLERNVKQLGVDLGASDMIVISHAHPDHCGGLRAWWRRSFDLPNEVRSGIPVRTPVLMDHLTARCELVRRPGVLASGIATTGTIARQLFWLGWTPEQALIVNVRGKGIVVIIGCGHQGLARLISRVRMLTEEPICAVIGGLHLPVRGLYTQGIIGSAEWPWRYSTDNDVAEAIEVLHGCQPLLVALSPHDSSAWTRRRFAEAFADGYRNICVGDEIVISSRTG